MADRISFRCTSCNAQLTVRADMAGKRGKCKYCSALNTVPTALDAHVTPDELQVFDGSPPSESVGPPVVQRTETRSRWLWVGGILLILGGFGTLREFPLALAAPLLGIAGVLLLPPGWEALIARLPKLEAYGTLIRTALCVAALALLGLLDPKLNDLPQPHRPGQRPPSAATAEATAGKTASAPTRTTPPSAIPVTPTPRPTSTQEHDKDVTRDSYDTNPPPVDSEFTNAIGMKLVYIPPGEFVMGTPDSEITGWGSRDRAISERQHRVKLTKGFYMGVTEVTRLQWESVMGSMPRDSARLLLLGGYTYSMPVTSVSWQDAVEFCEKLSSTEGKEYRLPTEAEWEYACRAGTTGHYAGTGRLKDMGWYKFTALRTRRAVGQKQPNAWGLYDMHGNVKEWCSDWYSDYPRHAQIRTDPVGDFAPGLIRVVRGGSWVSEEKACWASSRDANTYKQGTFDLGFRVALTALGADR